MKVYIIGAGPGSVSLLTGAARDRIAGADIVIAPPRLAEQMGTLNPNTVCKGIAEIPGFVASLRETCASAAVLVSGDPGFFSLAKTLRPCLLAVRGIEVECLGGLSSLQYFCAKLGLGYEDMSVVSAHGRESSVIPPVCYNPFVFALAGGETKAHTLIAQLAHSGLDKVSVSVGEKLSAPGERILSGTPRELVTYVFDDLAALIIHNPRFVNRHERPGDSEFIRGASPMTKQAVRALAVDALNIQPSDRVLDIGAGTGSVAVDMARKAYLSFVHAVERRAEAVELLRQNRGRFGAYNMEILHAEAPEALDGLPPVDKAFIGGSGGALPAVIHSLVSRNPRTEIVVTAITLETLHTALASLSSHGFAPEVLCVNAALSRQLGGRHMMQAENPVYIIKGGKI